MTLFVTSTIGKSRLGSYGLVHVTPELLGKERQFLVDTPTNKDRKRTAATTNRYMASLSSFSTYATLNSAGSAKTPLYAS